MNAIFVSIIAFVVTLGILITIHEFGHFWVARKLGVKVLRFSIGFGKPLWSRRVGPDDTEYVLAALPLGGYVKMLDEREGEVSPSEAHRAFNRQSVPVRFAIVFAGPFVNFLFAIIAYWLISIIGVTGIKPIVGEVDPKSIAYQGGLETGDEIVAVEDKPTDNWGDVVIGMIGKAVDRGTVELTVRAADSETYRSTLDFAAAPPQLDRGDLLAKLGIHPARPALPAVIGQVQRDSAAAQAGLAPGDRILAANGREIANWEDWVVYVRERPEQLINTKVARNGETYSLDIRPTSITTEAGQIGRIGAAPELPDEIPESLRSLVRHSPGEAVSVAFAKSWEVTSLTLYMLGKMMVGQASVENISGPIGIAQYAGYSASDGLVSFLQFLAIVSISLGILNLLPIPLLDGGHLMYYLIEAVKGSPVSEKAQIVGQQLGIALLLSLTVLAFYNDFARLLE